MLQSHSLHTVSNQWKNEKEEQEQGKLMNITRPICRHGSVAQVGFLDSVSVVGWVCCWFSSLVWEIFLRVLRFSPLTNISKFQFDLDTVEEEPPSGCATANSHLFIYLFIYLFSVPSHV